MGNSSSRNAELGLFSSPYASLNSSSAVIFCFIALFAVRSIGKCTDQIVFFLILLACAFSHSFSFRLFICVLKRRKPPGIDLLVIGESNSSTQKGMNCPQGFRSSLLYLTTFVNSFKRACVCMCMCVCLVLTTDGKQCKFPFRFGGTIYHQCIPLNSNSKAW